MDIEIVINRAGIYGGIKRLYCIASYLQSAGHRVIVNSDDLKKNSWFKHSILENEAISPQIRICAETCRKLSPTAVNILFQQAQFDVPEPEESFDLMVTTTDYLSEFLNRNTDLMPDYQIPYGFDSKLFHPKPELRKPSRIAYMPRKNKEEADLVLQLMKDAPVEFIPIDGLSEDDVVRTLQKTDIFLALSREEGFGMPPFEASLCGCLIIGYHGRGGKKWLTDDTCVLVKSPQEFPVRISEASKGLHEGKRAALYKLITEHLTVEKERDAWLNVINHAIQIYSRRFSSRNSEAAR